MNGICRSEKPCILALQEIKCRELSEQWLEDLLGNNSFEFARKQASGHLAIIYQYGI